MKSIFTFMICLFISASIFSQNPVNTARIQYERLDSLFHSWLKKDNAYYPKCTAWIEETRNPYSPPKLNSTLLDIHISNMPMDSVNKYIFDFKTTKAFVKGYTEASEIDGLLDKVGFFKSKYLDTYFIAGVDVYGRHITYGYVKTKPRPFIFTIKEK